MKILNPLKQVHKACNAEPVVRSIEPGSIRLGTCGVVIGPLGKNHAGSHGQLFQKYPSGLWLPETLWHIFMNPRMPKTFQGAILAPKAVSKRTTNDAKAHKAHKRNPGMTENDLFRPVFCASRVGVWRHWLTGTNCSLEPMPGKQMQKCNAKRMKNNED